MVISNHGGKQLQSRAKLYIQLLNRPNVSGVTLREQNLSLKCGQSLEQKRGQDLSKEVLRVFVCQKAANLQSVKLLDDPIIGDSKPSHTGVVHGGLSSRIFFQTSNLNSL